MTSAQEAAEDTGSDEDRALLIEYWWRDYDAKTRRYKINVAYAAGNALLEVQLGVYDHGLYPFSILPCDTIEGCLAGEGLVTQLAPMMRYINRYMAYVDMNLRMASKTRALVRKDAGIDIEALADWENDIIEGNNITPDNIQWMSTPPFNSMINQMMLQLETDLKQDSGANQFTRGETTGGIVSGKAISALQTAGAKVQVARTQILNNSFKQIVKHVLWLMAEFYDEDRVIMVTGRRDGKRREIAMKAKQFFDKPKKGVLAPPPYTVQVEVITRDPSRIDQINNLYMQAFTMAAQMQQSFPLSALFRLLNIEGKDRLLPVIEENEQQQAMMQQMQQQIEQMGAQMQQLQQENQSLKLTSTDLTNALASAGVSANQQQATAARMPQAGMQVNTRQALIDNARAELMRPEIEE
jgi:regulator of replication initiation timing